MTEHDRVRMQTGIRIEEKLASGLPVDQEELEDAVRGLQSTDDPSLVPLHDRLMKKLQETRRRDL